MCGALERLVLPSITATEQPTQAIHEQNFRVLYSDADLNQLVRASWEMSHKEAEA